MSYLINLNMAELNKSYIVKKIRGDNIQLMNYGIYEGAPVVPLFRSMSGNICAYKTHYGIFAIRNETAKDIRVQYEE